MAKDNTPPAAAKKRSFKVKTPNTGFAGTRNGLKFVDGVAETEDAVAAHGCQEFGYEVLDAATGKPAWPKEQDEASADDGVAKKK